MMNGFDYLGARQLKQVNGSASPRGSAAIRRAQKKTDGSGKAHRSLSSQRGSLLRTLGVSRGLRPRLSSRPTFTEADFLPNAQGLLHMVHSCCEMYTARA